MVSYDDNPEALRAIRAIEDGKNLCLIGKAGAGKTTLVKYLTDKVSGNLAVLAPTGIAAINADGRTIHSLFKFPFRPLLPTEEICNKRYGTYSKENIAGLKTIDMLVIDEVSMVRADLLDAMDKIMQIVNRNDNPFGGIQVILVGDPFQLPPVITSRPYEENNTETEIELLNKYYDSEFFFDSNFFKANPPEVVELKKVYRQKDGVFVDILNNIRKGGKSMDDILTLNTRVEKSSEDNIYLTSTRKSAESINDNRMQGIDEKLWKYNAEQTGFFPVQSIPPDSKQVALKLGARVMCSYNDPEKNFVNGSLGTIIDINEFIVKVELDPDYVMSDDIIIVKKMRIENHDHNGKLTGSYRFMPLKPAWAITIHKSQGLTFSNVNICPKKIFAPGQLYVALSRCRSLEGMILTDPVRSNYVKVDTQILDFIEAYGK